MPMYSYEAVSLSGDTVKGEMEADTQEAVAEHLRTLGYLPVRAEQKADYVLKGVDFGTLSYRKKLSNRDLVFITRELATMLQAGLSLEKSLTILASLADKPKVAAFLDGVVVRMRTGTSFADSMALQDETLPRVFIGMIRAGEAGGGKMLEAALDQLADYLFKAQNLRDTIGSALLYPAILMVVAILSIAMILVYVLPQFEPLFATAGDALPLSTKALIAAGHFLRDYGLILCVVILGAGVAIYRSLRREAVRLKMDTLLLRLPKIGPLISKVETARFARTLGSLQRHGLPLVTGVIIAGESFSNKVFQQMALNIAARVREGETFSSLLSEEKRFPPLALQMIKIGEETGHLDTMLLKTADIQERDVQRLVERFMTVLTPIMTILMGVIIAAIIGSVMSAILSVNDLVL